MPLDSSWSQVTDFTNVKDSSGFNPTHQPAGDYRGVVKDVTAGKSNQGNDTVTFAIADANRPSAVYRYVCTFTDKSLWKLRNLVIAAGMSVPKKRIKLTAATLNKLIGKEIGMSLDDNEYEGKMSSQIMGVFPASDLPDDDGDTSTPVVEDDDDDDEDEVEEAPKKAAKKPAKKAKPAPVEEEEEDLDELDIDDL